LLDWIIGYVRKPEKNGAIDVYDGIGIDLALAVGEYDPGYPLEQLESCASVRVKVSDFSDDTTMPLSKGRKALTPTSETSTSLDHDTLQVFQANMRALATLSDMKVPIRRSVFALPNADTRYWEGRSSALSLKVSWSI
jgi:hypothetical protein